MISLGDKISGDHFKSWWQILSTFWYLRQKKTPKISLSEISSSQFCHQNVTNICVNQNIAIKNIKSEILSTNSKHLINYNKQTWRNQSASCLHFETGQSRVADMSADMVFSSTVNEILPRWWPVWDFADRFGCFRPKDVTNSTMSPIQPCHHTTMSPYLNVTNTTMSPTPSCHQHH